MEYKIKWHEWSDEAFARAKHEQKPVLLYITAVWCHWCHRLRDDTLNNDEIATIIEKNFIPIRVDADRRPDINERYNMGGWPTVAVLTSEGATITGGTYFPPNQMKTFLENAKNFYMENKGDMHAGRYEQKKERYVDLNESMVSDVLDIAVSYFDADHGGFGNQPKFPMPEALELLMLLHKKDKLFAKMITLTLDKMSALADRHAGGFFRYSVTQNWKLPHYEKMLETNAKILVNYLHGYQITGNEKYKQIAEQTISYIIGILSDDTIFFGSQDADKEEEFYGKPLEERAKMPTPYIDKTVYANWNGMMISALLDASIIIDNTDYRDRALKAIDFLIDNLFDKCMYHYFDGEKHLPGLLSDQVYFMRALLDAFEATQDKRYIEYAEKIATWCLENLKDDKGFFDKPGKGIGNLAISNKPITENAVAAECFLRLSFFTGNEDYRKVAEETLAAFSFAYTNHGIHAAAFALALDKFLNFIEINASENDIKKLQKWPEPRKMLLQTSEKGIFTCSRGVCQKFSNYEEFIKKFSFNITN